MMKFISVLRPHIVTSLIECEQCIVAGSARRNLAPTAAMTLLLVMLSSTMAQYWSTTRVSSLSLSRDGMLRSEARTGHTIIRLITSKYLIYDPCI